MTRHYLRFLWVYFQLLDLCDASSEFEVRKTLQALPQGMTATYTKILEKIAANRTNMGLARKMFKWIVCAKRPMLLTELTEAVAFEATDTSWNKEKVLDAVRLYQAGGNLVVIDEKDDTVRLAHHTVQQFLLNLPDHQSAIAIPFHFRLSEANLEAGEICVAYLSFSDFERQISTLHPHNVMPVINLPLPAAILGRTTSKLGLNFAVSRLFNFAHYLRTGEATEETASIDFSKFAKLKVPPPEKLQEKYLFLTYAIENWIGHTSNLSEHNANIWRLFEKLAINKPLPFDIRPWGDVNESNATTYTTLLRCASNAEHIPLMKLVPQSCFIEDQTLFRMALKGKVNMIELLLMEGVDIEARDNVDGRTALIRATMEGHAAAVELLLAKGAEIEAKDDKGRTPLCWAAIHGHADVVRLLLTKDAGIEGKDDSGRTALDWTIEKWHAGVVDDINAKDYKERMNLSFAAEGEHASVIRLLLAKNPRLGWGGSDERSALHTAATGGDVDVVKLLLAKGADFRAKDSRGLTALDCARKEGRWDIVHLLEESSLRGVESFLRENEVFFRKNESFLRENEYFLREKEEFFLREEEESSLREKEALSIEKEALLREKEALLRAMG